MSASRFVSNSASEPPQYGWVQQIIRLLPFVLMYAGLILLETVAVSKIDRWLPVSTMEDATNYSYVVAAVAQWLRYCFVGAAVFALLKSVETSVAPYSTVALPAWSLLAFVFAASSLAIDFWQSALRMTGEEISGEQMRSTWLFAHYVEVTLGYFVFRLLTGIVLAGRGVISLSRAWTATSFGESLVLYVGFLLLKLFVDEAFVTAVSYIPFVAPFWFVPDEFSEMRYFVGQGVRIAAASAGLLFYVFFFANLHRMVRTHR